MDERYAQLQDENIKLNRLLAVKLTQQARTSKRPASNQSSSTALYIVTKLAKQASDASVPIDIPTPTPETMHYREELETKALEFAASFPETVDELRSVAAALASRLLNEQALRLNVEEKATQLISKEEVEVGRLVRCRQESQVKALERKQELSS